MIPANPPSLFAARRLPRLCARMAQAWRRTCSIPTGRSSIICVGPVPNGAPSTRCRLSLGALW
jgi:hypothetical protein